MKRTDSDGATIGNKFTNGNPGLGVPATTVDDNWLNTIQEEIALFIEAQGITLDQTGADVTQFQDALNAFALGGGVGIADFVIANNETGPTDITGLVFDKALVKSARITVDIFRSTDSANFTEIGHLWVVYNPTDDDWDYSLDTRLDDAVVTFSVIAAGQVQYSSDLIAGGSYVGTLKMKNITKVAI